MSPRSGVLSSALLLGGVLSLAVPAHAQRYDVARRLLGFAPDPIERSPRLLGMGRLNLVIPDANNGITLWDFAGNPAGLIDDDSVSTLSLRPGSSSISSVHDFQDLLGRGERQDLAARETRLGFEAWRRTAGSSVFGAVGDVGALRMDEPYDREVERRSLLTRPSVASVLGGRLPYVPARLNYAIRLHYGAENANDEYRRITRNAAGEYIDRDGLLGPPPELFSPDEISVQTQGGGGGILYRFGPWLTAAVGADGVRHKILAENRADRYVSERRETRPYGIGQASLVGRIGRAFEWGADGRGWRSSSNETWVFTISTNTGGGGALPFVGRGDFQEREEEGSTLRTRARWVLGALELGGSLGTSYRKITLTPPPASDLTSFNRFLSTVYYRTRADTTAYPDSAVFNESQERTWNAAGGASWRLPGGRGILGAEYHRWRDLFEQTVSGSGPRSVGWDVRGGLEYRLNEVLLGRLGYAYRWQDLDEFTAQNEHLSNTTTLGLGLAQPGSRWRLDAGYALEWFQADYGTPTQPRGTRQQFAAQVEWAF